MKYPTAQAQVSSADFFIAQDARLDCFREKNKNKQSNKSAQVQKNNFFWFLVQMRTRKFAFKIY